MSNKIVACLLGFIFFIVGVWTLPHYGINWDTINHLPRGQAYLHFFLTGKKDFTDLSTWKQYWQDPDTLWIKSDIPKSEIPVRSYYQSVGTNFNWFMERDGNGHPPLSDIFSSFFNLLFFQNLRLVNDIDSYRIYGIFLAAGLIGLVYYWLAECYGKFAGLISSLSLSLSPLFWSESHFNTEKDIPETVFWSFLLFCFWNGVTKKSWKWLLASGIFFGLALGTKFNILFAFFVVVPWLTVYLLRNKLRDAKKIIFSSIGAILIGITIFIGTWPYLWADPLSRIIKVFKYYKAIGLTENIDPNFLGLFKINTYPIFWILYTTPIIILTLFLTGILISILRARKDKNLTSAFFLLWFLVPIVRVIWPGATVYGGVRQVMEYVPAMAILAGIGSKYLRQWLVKVCGYRISYFVVLVLFIPITLKLVQIHPNENVYFNSFIGGLAGAKFKKIPFWGNSFGSAYRQGVSWINKNAAEESKVVLAYELLPNIPSIWFKRNINFHNSARSGYLRYGEYAITLTYQGTAERSYYDSYLENFINPVYQVTVDGVSILKVWKNDDAHLKSSWKEELVSNAIVKKSESGLTFDLGKLYKLSRLKIDYKETNCNKLSSGIVRVSKDSKKWETLPGVLPNAWRISALGVQPSDGHFIEPFVGQETRYIDLLLSPSDTCLKSIRTFRIFSLI